MKIKKITLVALSVMVCLCSCKKDNEQEQTVVEGNPKALTLKIQLPDRAPGTRASVDNPVTNVGALISTLDVYFYAVVPGLVYTKVSLTPAQMTAISGGSGLTFPNLSPSVNGVVVVANNNANKNISVDQGANISDIFPKELDAQYEQDFDEVTFYGKSETFVEVNPENPEPDIDYYTTYITIIPFVARIEVSELTVGAMDIAGDRQNLDLHSIWIENVYQRSVVDTSVPVENSLLVLADDYNTTIEATPHLSDWWIYSYNAGHPRIPRNDPSNTFSPDVTDPTQDGSGVFAFHFIPSSTKPPWIRLFTVSEASPRPWYINIRGFVKDGVPVTFQAGYIYKITVPFTESDCTEYDDELRDVTVEVTIQDWTIVNGIVPE